MHETTIRSGVLAAALVGCLAMTSPAFAGDYRLVPGRRAGSIFLDMDRGSVHKLLGQPSHTVHVPSGLLLETWLPKRHWTGESVSEARTGDNVAILFRRNHVVQIEVTSPHFATASGFSTEKSMVEWEKHYHPYRTTSFQYENKTGERAHTDLIYEDDVQDGIAWMNGASGNLAPDPDPNEPIYAIEIHQRGRRVIPAAGGH